LKQYERLSWAVERNLMPCPSDGHQGQPLVHLAPSTNLLSNQATNQQLKHSYKLVLCDVHHVRLLAY